MGTGKKQTKPKIKVHKLSYVIVISALLIAGGLLMFRFVRDWREDRRQSEFQDSIQSFYDPPSPLPADPPGHVIRYQKMDNVDVPHGGTAYRVLYLTQTPEQQPALSSGMVFVPQTHAPAGGRKVIAWAHGTLGLGDECAPSRSYTNPLNDMQFWLEGAMERGYVVTATDYAGVGTPGDTYYLIGKSEAYDVINMVRAAREIPEAGAGSEFIAWGHSQGGHSALFTAQETASYAPELNLRGVAAAAPAAELRPLFAQQYDQTVSWAIGPDVAVSWPNVYPELNTEAVLSGAAKRDYKRLAGKCIEQQVTGLAIRRLLKEKFFDQNPTQKPPWALAISEQTPDLSKIQVPMYIAQGLSDVVVPPNTTALLAQKACQAGKTLEMNWMGKMNHRLAAVTAGPSALAWMQDRFNAQTAPSSCDQPLPVDPA